VEGLTSFVKLRRGILEHLPERITFEEYAVYTLVILKADHRNGAWRGCALALSKIVGKSERWCQRILASLRHKGYITGNPSTGRGQYSIRVVKYFEKASAVSPSTNKASTVSPSWVEKASVVTPYQEVMQEEKIRRKPAQPRRGSHSPEQIRQIEAKQKRLQVEVEIARELYVGAGPMCADRELMAEVSKLAARKSL
jgi:hypothetical protein